ncbi:MAG TPA: PQQ-dependent sugar dehydrogenase [Rhizomicrobium sp.]|jgi:glucose/arabinose dehydrogenase|nr:PQQ-dependent sugar dehydrogenase [Rhizomicrobium sp.]
MNRFALAWLCSLAAYPCATALAQTPAPTKPPPANQSIPDYATVQEGKPIDTRPPELSTDHPLFPEQTRAPYHKTAPYKLTEITGRLYAPWAVAFLPDGKFLVTEKLPGALRVVDKAGNISAPVKGLEALGVTWPETGLFDLALDPHFATNHRIFFTFFAFDKGMIGGNQVASATFDEATNSLSNVKVIFRAIPQTPNDNKNGVGSRSGGRLAIGRDGFLYITIGDRDAGGSFPWRVAQTLDTDLGKIIRITMDGKPAPGNPFIGTPGALPEIWATGQRSQEGLAFDPSGRLWEVEHGPRGGDELNLIEKGKNYGWPIISHGIDYPGPPIGDAEVAKPGMEQPVYYWSPSTAPSGTAFYTGNLFPEWKNSVFVGMLRGNSLERLGMANGKVVNEEPLLTEVHMRIRDVRVGPDGAVYVLTDSGGGSITDDTAPRSKLLKLTPQ